MSDGFLSAASLRRGRFRRAKIQGFEYTPAPEERRRTRTAIIRVRTSYDRLAEFDGDLVQEHG